MANPSQSRLDREIDEILEKKANEPVPFQPRQNAQSRRRSPISSWQRKLTSARQWLARMPLALAYAFVLLAMIVHDASPLLALLLSTAAVAAIWYPAIRRLTQPSTPTASNVKYWRGKPYVTDIKSAVSRSPIDSLKRYFDRRR